jgi:hypothetical protein
MNLNYIYKKLILNRIKIFNNLEVDYKIISYSSKDYKNNLILEDITFNFIDIFRSYFKIFSIKTYIKLFLIKNSLLKFFNISNNISIYNNSLFKKNKELLYTSNIINLNILDIKKLYSIKLPFFIQNENSLNFHIWSKCGIFKKDKNKKRIINLKRLDKSIVYKIIKGIFYNYKKDNTFLHYKKGLWLFKKKNLFFYKSFRNKKRIKPVLKKSIYTRIFWYYTYFKKKGFLRFFKNFRYKFKLIRKDNILYKKNIYYYNFQKNNNYNNYYIYKTSKLKKFKWFNKLFFKNYKKGLFRYLLVILFNKYKLLAYKKDYKRYHKLLKTFYKKDYYKIYSFKDSAYLFKKKMDRFNSFKLKLFINNLNTDLNINYKRYFKNLRLAIIKSKNSYYKLKVLYLFYKYKLYKNSFNKKKAFFLKRMALLRGKKNNFFLERYFLNYRFYKGGLKKINSFKKMSSSIKLNYRIISLKKVKRESLKNYKNFNKLFISSFISFYNKNLYKNFNKNYKNLFLSNIKSYYLKNKKISFYNSNNISLDKNIFNTENSYYYYFNKLLSSFRNNSRSNYLKSFNKEINANNLLVIKRYGTIISSYNFYSYSFINSKVNNLIDINKKYYLLKRNKTILLGLKLLIINNMILKFNNNKLFKLNIAYNFLKIDKVLNNFYRFINIFNIYFTDIEELKAYSNFFTEGNTGIGIGGYSINLSNLILNHTDNSYILSKELISCDNDEKYLEKKDYFSNEIGCYRSFYNLNKKVLNIDLGNNSENIIDSKFYRLLFNDNKYIFNNSELIDKVCLYYSYFDWLYYNKKDILSTNKYYYYAKRVNKLEFNIYIKPKIIEFLELMERLWKEKKAKEKKTVWRLFFEQYTQNSELFLEYKSE